MAVLLKALLGILTGAAGEKVGGAVARGAELVAVAGIVGAAVLWLKENGDDVFMVLTYKDLAFWGLLFCGFAYVIVRLVHRAPPPAPPFVPPYLR